MFANRSDMTQIACLTHSLNWQLQAFCRFGPPRYISTQIWPSSEEMLSWILAMVPRGLTILFHSNL